MTIYDTAKNLREKLAEELKNPLKIALFGQPGSGKSSIINRLVGKNIADIGVSTDKTKEAECFEWNDSLLLCDLPGYGTTSFPADNFIDEFNVYGFDLYLCVFAGKFHQADTEFFSDLTKRGKVCLFVRNHSDTIWENGKGIDELEKEIAEDCCKQARSRVHVYFTSCRTNEGIKDLSEAIYNNTDEAKKAKWARSAKAYSIDFLEKKKRECERLIYIASGAAAANAINPVPVADISIDITVLVKLFSSIRNSYGLTDEKLNFIKNAVPPLTQVVNNVFKYAAKDGILILLKKFAARETVKEVTKYIPFVGQAIAATIGYGITSVVSQ